MSLSPDAQTRMLAAAHRALEEHPTQAPWWRSALAIMAMQGVVAGAALLAMGGHVGLGNRAPEATLWAVSGVLMSSTLLATWAALAPRRSARVGLLLASAASGGAVLLGASTVQGGPLIPGLMRCGFSELGIALLPLCALLLTLRSFAARRGHLLSAGAAAAGVGLLVLHIHCPNGAPSHLLLGHLLPAALLTLAAGLLPRPGHGYVP